MDLRYPIGKLERKSLLSPAEREAAIAQIAATPKRLRDAVAGLSREQLDTPYRPDGWTVRQVVHHIPDSHLNAYIRFKLALTENEPTIKPYRGSRGPSCRIRMRPRWRFRSRSLRRASSVGRPAALDASGGFCPPSAPSGERADDA